MAAPAPTTAAPVATQQPMQGQPVQQPMQGQPMPWANFFNKIGNTLENIGNQANQIVQTGTTSVIQGTQNYVSDMPTAPLDTQQFLSQNYQPNTPLQQPVQGVQPMQQPVAPVTQPTIPVAPVAAQPTVPVAPVVQPQSPIPTQQ